MLRVLVVLRDDSVDGYLIRILAGRRLEAAIRCAQTTR